MLLGNVEFQPRKSYHHHDEAVGVKNPEVVALISELLRVKQETLLSALTAKRARASGETLVINYRLPEAIAARDAMAKCLYGALFDWIVLQVTHFNHFFLYRFLQFAFSRSTTLYWRRRTHYATTRATA